VDWGREIDTAIPEVTDTVQTADEWSVVRTIIRRAPELNFSEKYRVVHALPISRIDRKIALVPAIAIPIQRKDQYECPVDHVDILEGLLPKVQRVVIVGWRGREETFVRKMVEKLPEDTRTVIVSRDLESAGEVRGFLLTSGYPRQIGIAGDGFTGFTIKDQFQQFLSWDRPGEELRLD
jgi:hypothetical protein